MTELSVIPSGAISAPLDEIQRTFAASPTFQVATGSADEVEALERIHLSPVTWNDILAKRFVDHRPYIVITPDQGAVNWTQSSLDTHHPGGTYRIVIEDNEDTLEQNKDDAMLKFTNLVGDVIQEAIDYSYDPGLLKIEDIQLTIARSDPREDESQRPHWHAFGTLNWIQVSAE